MALPLSAAFAPPAEGPVPFRRDRLPLDVDTMMALSRQVTVLARTAADFPREPRTVAQMAALALALDPANREARGLIEAMQQGSLPEAAGREEVERARNRGWHLLSWLESPEAGPDGQALAACLGDILAAADPEHPRAKGRTAEQGAWKGWIPEPEAYRPKPEPPPEPEPLTEPEVKGPVLAAATVTMPIWYRDKDEGPVCRLLEVRMRARVEEENTALLRTTNTRLTLDWEQEGATVRTALADRLGPLPAGLRLMLIFPREHHYEASDNAALLTGMAAVLLDAAMSGKVPGAAVLAVVEADGSLSLPPRFWEALRGLSAQPGMRLVVPAVAAEYLAGLLVLDDAAFFMKHEVLLAQNVEELCELAAGEPGETVAEGLAAFAEIRRAGEGRGLGSFVAHPSTQQRLGQVVSLLPAHASARLLALQGSGGRPRFLDRKILAREIRGALEPLAYLEGRSVDQIDPLRLDKIHEFSRVLLDKMPGHIDTRDRDLHRQVVSAVDNLRTLSRAMRLNNPEKYMEIRARRTDTLKNAHQEYIRLMEELTAAAGDQKEYEMPPPVKSEE